MIDFIYTYVEPLFIIFIIFAIAGWLIEVVGKLFQEHKFINRGFLIGPYCPIYGWGAVIMTVLLSSYKGNVFVLFVMSMFICSVLEYLTSYFMEKFYHARWWDYSEKKFNINGRVCLDFAVLFGIGGVIIIEIIDPFIYNIIGNISQNTINIICIVLFAIIMFDNLISGIIIRKFKNLAKSETRDATETISLKVKDVLSSYTDKILDDVRNKTDIINDKIAQYRKEKTISIQNKMSNNYFQKRLIKAFPNAVVKVKKSKKIINDLKK